jgi:hypothetical protein
VDGTVLTRDNGGLWKYEPGTWHFDVAMDDEATFTVVAEDDSDSEELTVTVRYDPDLVRAFGRIVAVEPGGLVLDPQTILLGAEAEAYLGTEAVDGYHIIDEEPGVLETWPMADDLPVLLYEELAVPPPLWREVRVSVDRLSRILAGDDEGLWWLGGQNLPAWVYLEDGVVVQIRVRWAP